jgi:hypothetical protein
MDHFAGVQIDNEEGKERTKKEVSDWKKIAGPDVFCMIPLANPKASDDKEREKKEKEEKQAKERSEEKIDVTQTTTRVSSPSRNGPSRTSRIPNRQRVHANARCAGKHLHR